MNQHYSIWLLYSEHNLWYIAFTWKQLAVGYFLAKNGIWKLTHSSVWDCSSQSLAIMHQFLCWHFFLTILQKENVSFQNRIIYYEMCIEKLKSAHTPGSLTGKAAGKVQRNKYDLLKFEWSRSVRFFLL